MLSSSKNNLTNSVCEEIFRVVYFVRYILSSKFCPVHVAVCFVRVPFVWYILSGMYCPDIFCPVYFVRVYFVQVYFVRIYLVQVYFIQVYFDRSRRGLSQTHESKA